MLNLKVNRWLLASIVAPGALLMGCSGVKSISQGVASPPIAASPAGTTTQQVFTPTEPKIAQASTSDGRRISLENGGVSFVLPPGFTEMTAEEIAFKFPNRGGNPPKFAYGNDRRSVAIAVTFSQVPVAPEQLPELKTAMQEQLKKLMPSAEWLKQEMTTINDKPWVHFSMVTQAIDTKIHNDMYFTSYEGKMMGFNFNSTVKEYEGARANFETIRNSIQIR